MGNKIIILFFIILFGISYLKAESETINDNYFWGQPVPESTAVKFAAGIVSTDSREFSITFTKDMKILFFTRKENNSQQTLFATEFKNDKISEPVKLSISGTYGDFEPFITPDGKKLVFQSWRPHPFDTVGKGPDMWYLKKTEDGWSEPIHFGKPFEPGKYMYNTMSNSGTIYSGLFVEGDIVESKINDEGYGNFNVLEPPINTEYSEQYPFIAQDESYLIFNSNRPTTGISSNLFISYKTHDGNWSEAQMIETGFEKSVMGIVTPDGKYLFFTHKGDIYWMSSKVLDKINPNKK